MGDISWSPAGESNKWELININKYRWITTERRGCASARTGKNEVTVELKFKHEKRSFRTFGRNFLVLISHKI